MPKEPSLKTLVKTKRRTQTPTFFSDEAGIDIDALLSKTASWGNVERQLLDMKPGDVKSSPKPKQSIYASVARFNKKHGTQLKVVTNQGKTLVIYQKADTNGATP